MNTKKYHNLLKKRKIFVYFASQQQLHRNMPGVKSEEEEKIIIIFFLKNTYKPVHNMLKLKKKRKLEEFVKLNKSENTIFILQLAREGSTDGVPTKL